MERKAEPQLRQGLLIVVIALGAAVIQSVFQLSDVFLSKDSIGYINAEAYRGVVYPAFLDMFESLAHPLRAAVIAQTWLFSIAAAVLAVTFAKFSGKPNLGLVLILLLIVNPMTYYFNNSILTESLFQSSLCLFLAAVIRLCYKLDWKSCALLGLSAGLMVISRPVGYAALPALVVTLIASGFLNHKKIWKAAVVSVASVVLVLAAEKFAYALYQDAERESVLGNVLFSKSGVISAGQSPYPVEDPRTEIWNFLEYGEAQAAREAIAKAPPGHISFFILHGYEADMLFRYKKDELAALAEQAGRPQRQLMGEIGAERLKRNISGFLSLPLKHYIAHWQPFYYAISQEEIDDYIAVNSPLPMDNASGRFNRDVYTPPYATAIHIVLAIGWVISVTILVLSVLCFGKNWNGRRMLTCAGLAVLLLHGLLLLSSIVSIAAVRYLAVLWPIVAVVMCAGVVLILELKVSGRQAAEPDPGLSS
ncbi:glycosyltransferase family 39 protein [Roseibium sp. RKSG952]|uniref:glycosyltransferase family 39 protein n=1 Tax=Roseibium sp. RKSG952 TaxID=2529384 RepID=UPI0012BD4FA4|nr:glycosyltransferase family 39 protein [Roseibium sp. RKSG952]MTH98444.1 hypothetical protein [Roseibium sp. RKSG952]